METKRTFCRICTASCPLDMDVEDNKVIAVRPVPEDPVNGGYSCILGRELPFQLQSEKRLKRSLKRQADGSFKEIPTSVALDEIAEQLGAIREKHGPDAIATLSGTGAYNNTGSVPAAFAFAKALGSRNNFSTMTIDQPAKVIAVGRMGVWGAGGHAFKDSNVAMVVGLNPLVSSLGQRGAPPNTNPSRKLQDAIKAGLQLIVVDPRRTELAKLATIHLQLKPGEDATLLAGLLHIIFAENLHDQAFCAEHVSNLEPLQQSVAPFSPAYVAERAGVSETDLCAAARLFAKGPRGFVSSGTGPDMGPRACLAEVLISSINTVCGRWNRQGDAIANPGVMQPEVPPLAQAIPPEFLPEFFWSGKGDESRVRPGLFRVCNEMPTATLADEILVPGEGQVRALIINGANPVTCLPNAAKISQALDEIPFSVCLDITLTDSAKKADYVIPALHSLEREDVTDYMDLFYEEPYCFYTRPVVEPDDECIEDYAFYCELASRMGATLQLDGGPVEGTPDKVKFLELIKPSTRIPWNRIRDEAGGGKIFTELAMKAEPPMEGMDAGLNICPPGIADELAEVHAELFEDQAYPFRLVCNRVRHAHNSVGQNNPALLAKGSNHAQMHPDDLIGCADGDTITVRSRNGELKVAVQANPNIRPGVIAISHGWGEGGEGVNVNHLTGGEFYDAISGMPLMTAVPVAIESAI